MNDRRRATFDYLSQFHLAVLLILFPDEPAALLARRLDIPDLVTELHARTLHAQSDRVLVERQIAAAQQRAAEGDERRKARKRAILAPYLSRISNG